MNFRKVRKRKQLTNNNNNIDSNTPNIPTIIRSWERGFLSADCGDFAPDDINYLSLYKPDIEGRETAICNYVFNETVLLYSHENIRNFASMVTDYLQVFLMIWLSGYSRQTRDVTFFNLDNMKRSNKFHYDMTNQFFR
jgi:hypothetical protein